MLEDSYSSFGEEIARMIDRRAQETLTPLCAEGDTVTVGMYVQSRDGETVEGLLGRANDCKRKVEGQLLMLFSGMEFSVRRICKTIESEPNDDPLERTKRVLAIGFFADVPRCLWEAKAGGFACPI